MKYLIVLLSLLVLLPSSWAQAPFHLNNSVRGLGMGNAYTSVATNGDSLFYNPAALNRVGGVNLTLVDAQIGLSGVEALSNSQDVQSQGGFSSTLKSIYGTPIWLGGGGKASLTMPHFGFAAYTTLDGQLGVNNPAYPELNLNYVNDSGFALGTSVSLLPGMHMGLVAKRVTRKGTDATFGIGEIGTLDPEPIFANLDNSGTGYSLDMGFDIAPGGPANPVLSFVWKDIGTTTYIAEGSGSAPPVSKDEMIVGTSMTFDAGLISVTPAIDFRHLNDSDVQLGKKLNMGVEIAMPLIDLRGGFHQGYYTAGVTFDLGPLSLDAATYGVELGEYPGQLEDRRYVLQTTIEFDIDTSSFSGSRSSRKYRLKQRR